MEAVRLAKKDLRRYITKTYSAGDTVRYTTTRGAYSGVVVTIRDDHMVVKSKAQRARVSVPFKNIIRQRKTL